MPKWSRQFVYKYIWNCVRYIGTKVIFQSSIIYSFLRKNNYCELENLLYGIEWEVNDWKKSQGSYNLCLNESKHNKYDKQVE